jgi:small subunit ribosomal protein S20
VANTKSAKKDARRSAARAVRNRSVKSAVKTKVTKFRRAVAAGEEGLSELALVAVSALDRAASKGILHPNNAARRKARLVKRLNAAASAEATEAAAPAPASRGRAKTTTRATTRTSSSRAKK